MKVQTSLAAVAIVLAGIAPAFASTTTLKGNFTPDNETTLMKQLTPLGFVDFNTYQHNPDGSAVIRALDHKGSMEPLASITVSKDGIAVATDNDMNTQSAAKHG
ncbi:MAG: hypothetical protein WAO76_11070 [Georgfuchsia sp.]